MTQEQIKQQARIERDKCIEVIKQAYEQHGDIRHYTEATYTIEVFGRQLFEKGAKWRIDSVWHKPEEKPEENKHAVCITGTGLPLICGPYHEHWEDTVSYIGITKWAYTDDLLPEEE